LENSFYIILAFFFIAIEGFFSAAEMSFISTSKYFLNILAERRKKIGKILLSAFSSPDRILTTTLIGTNLFMNLSAVFFSTFFIKLGISNPDMMAGSLLLPLIFLFGEVGPKFIGKSKTRIITPFILPVIWWLSYLFYPLVVLVFKLRSFLEKILGLESLKNKFHTREEMTHLIETSHFFKLDPFEREGLKTIMEIKTKRVEDVMIPISKVALVEKNRIDEGIVELFKKYGFSRYPVYEERVDNIIGIINIYDYLRKDEWVPGIRVMKSPIYIPEKAPLMSLLNLYAKHKEEMMIAVDEFGGCTGIITLKDFWSELIGRLGDEHVREEIWIEVHERNRFIIKGEAKIERLNEEFGFDIEDGEWTTMSGFIMGKFGRIPEKGEIFYYRGLKIKILDTDGRFIKKVEVIKG